MTKLDQSKTPYVDALKNYVSEGVAPFDVPGHHMGNIKNKATELFGQELFQRITFVINDFIDDVFHA